MREAVRRAEREMSGSEAVFAPAVEAATTPGAALYFLGWLHGQRAMLRAIRREVPRG